MYVALRINMARYKAWFLGYTLYTKLLDSILNFLLADDDDVMTMTVTCIVYLLFRKPFQSPCPQHKIYLRDKRQRQVMFADMPHQNILPVPCVLNSFYIILIFYGTCLICQYGTKSKPSIFLIAPTPMKKHKLIIILFVVHGSFKDCSGKSHYNL